MTKINLERTITASKLLLNGHIKMPNYLRIGDNSFSFVNIDSENKTRELKEFSLEHLGLAFLACENFLFPLKKAIDVSLQNKDHFIKEYTYEALKIKGMSFHDFKSVDFFSNSTSQEKEEYKKLGFKDIFILCNYFIKSKEYLSNYLSSFDSSVLNWLRTPKGEPLSLLDSQGEVVAPAERCFEEYNPYFNELNQRKIDRVEEQKR